MRARVRGQGQGERRGDGSLPLRTAPAEPVNAADHARKGLSILRMSFGQTGNGCGLGALKLTLPATRRDGERLGGLSIQKRRQEFGLGPPPGCSAAT